MIKVEELFIAPTATVLETLRKLDETGQRILFIAPEGHLISLPHQNSLLFLNV